MKIIFASFFALAFAGRVLAADVVSDFTTANRFYAEGKFSEAAKAYGAILQAGAQSPALLFNYGNAEFKLGNLGKAISAFRRAELLAPRDPEIRANLNFVRNQVQGPAIRESRWGEWLGTFSLNEWALLAAAAFWLTFLLFAARQIRPALVSKLRSVTRLAVALTALSGAALGVQAANHFNSPVAVVTDAEATARSGPFDEAQNAFTARDGAELSILDRHADWVQITDGAGKIGWLPTTQVEILPGA